MTWPHLAHFMLEEPPVSRSSRRSSLAAVAKLTAVAALLEALDEHASGRR
jgi:hypothetical protein